MINNIISKTLLNIPLTIEECYDLVKLLWTKENPNKIYKEDIVQKAFNIGLGNNIVQYYINKIITCPSDYGIQINTWKDKTGKILKQECKKL